MNRIGTDNGKATEDISEFIKGNAQSQFKPVAYYDERLDCVRVITRDCSVSEYRVNDFLTIAEDSHPTDLADRYVGFTIKGIRHFVRKNDKPEILELAVMLDKILADLPTYVTDMEAKKVVEFAVSISMSILEKANIQDVPLKKAA
jgi:hypothetical protein